MSFGKQFKTIKRPPKSTNVKRSRAKSDKLNCLLDQLAQEHFHSLPVQEEKATAQFLQHDLKLQDEELDAETIWDAVEKSDYRLVKERADSTHMPVLKCAMAICKYVRGSKERLKQHIPVLAKKAGMPLNGKFKVQIAALRFVNNYDKDDRRLWSRDSQAMEWLEHEKVTSAGLMDWQEENGGGVDSWARLEQARKRKEKAETGAAMEPKDTTAAVRLKALRKELEDGAGAIIMVKKRGLQLVSIGYKKLPEAEKRKYWPILMQAVSEITSAKKAKNKTKKKAKK